MQSYLCLVSHQATWIQRQLVKTTINLTHLLYATFRNFSIGLIFVYSTKVVVFPVPKQNKIKIYNLQAGAHLFWK